MTFEQIKKNIQYGDYNVLQKLIGAKTVAGARQRFLREDEEAVKAMKTIQENREKLIQEFTNNQSA